MGRRYRKRSPNRWPLFRHGMRIDKLAPNHFEGRPDNATPAPTTQEVTGSRQQSTWVQVPLRAELAEELDQGLERALANDESGSGGSR